MATIIGTPGNDVLNGTLESDQIFGGGGADSIFGDLGQDTAVFAGARAGYNVLFDEGFFPAEIPPSIQVGQPGQPLSALWSGSVEKLAFDDFTVDAAHADTGLEYIASYADLAAAFGADNGAGTNHFFASGHAEGRTITFDGLDYIASYNDLLQAFSANTDAGATHYIGFGAAESRTTTFDGLQYIAGYDDLIVALGANRTPAPRTSLFSVSAKVVSEIASTKCNTSRSTRTCRRLSEPTPRRLRFTMSRPDSTSNAPTIRFENVLCWRP